MCRNTKGVGVNRPGAFADYVAIPQHNVVPIPDDVPDEIAAIFDPLGNAVHTALSFDLVGEDVLVTGATMLVEAGNALQLPGRVREPVADWNKYSQMLSDRAMRAELASAADPAMAQRLIAGWRAPV